MKFGIDEIWDWGISRCHSSCNYLDGAIFWIRGERKKARVEKAFQNNCNVNNNNTVNNNNYDLLVHICLGHKAL